MVVSHLVAKLFVTLFVSLSLFSQLCVCREIDMEIHWNDQIPLENPASLI